KMGDFMNQRLLKGGHSTVVYDRGAEAVQAAAGLGSTPSTSLADMVSKMSKPRAIWLMIPAGDPTESTIDELMGLLEAGDIIIDGGNSNYKDSIRRAEKVKEKGLNFVDVGTSGGIWGLKEGYSMMVGGDKQVVESLTPIFQTLAPAPD